MARHKQLSMKGLADFMVASPVQQRTILRQHKYPDEDEAQARIIYYREARDIVQAYHAGRHDRVWLDGRASVLESLAKSSPKGRTRTRLSHNARAVTQYGEHFGACQYKVLSECRLDITFEGVRITVVPDLHVEEKGVEKIIKLDFGATASNPEVVKIVSQLMFEAAERAGMGLQSSGVLYLDVPRGVVHRGARAGSRVRANIDASCKNIAAIWESL